MGPHHGSAVGLCLSGPKLCLLCIVAAGCESPGGPDTHQIVLNAIVAADIEPAAPGRQLDAPPPSTSSSQALPATEPASQPSADTGPIDRVGERPHLIRDAPRETRVELAKKLVNPLSDLIRMPVQMNYDEGFGATGANRFAWTFQPYLPFRLNENWNLISRTVIPLVRQQSPIPGGDDQSGLGDIGQSFLLAPQDRKYMWAVGPAFLFPSADENFIGLEKWAAGPNVIWLEQQGPWTGGVIGSHLWSFAGNDDRRNVNVTTLSPFIAYTTNDAYTFLFEVDGIYDWDMGTHEAWLVPMSLSISRVRRLGRHLVSVGAAGRWYAESPENGPEWGVRVFVTYLFEK
jgi:hypothetical protein